MLAWLMNMGFAGGGTVTTPSLVGAGCTEEAEVFAPGMVIGSVYNPGPERSGVFTPGSQAAEVACC